MENFVSKIQNLNGKNCNKFYPGKATTTVTKTETLAVRIP